MCYIMVCVFGFYFWVQFLVMYYGINGTFCVVCLSLKTPIEVPIKLGLIDQELEHFPNVTEKLAKAS